MGTSRLVALYAQRAPGKAFGSAGMAGCLRGIPPAFRMPYASHGAIAQLVEHLHGMQGVSGSNPLGSIEKPNPTFLLRQVGFLFWTLPCPKWPQKWALFLGHRVMEASPSAMLRYREHQRLSERTQSELRVDSTPRGIRTLGQHPRIPHAFKIEKPCWKDAATPVASFKALGLIDGAFEFH